MDAGPALARANLLWAGANPFAEDPVDAIGSIGFEVALVAGLLSLARALRVYRALSLDDHRPRLILRGVGIVLLALGTTVVADAIQEIQQPGWNTSIWGKLLILGLACLAAFGLLIAVMLAGAARGVWAAPASPSSNGSGWLGEAIEDVFLMGWLPLAWLGRRVPPLARVTRWAESIGRGPSVRRLGAALAWASPWTHIRVALCASDGAGGRCWPGRGPCHRGPAARPGPGGAGVAGIYWY